MTTWQIWNILKNPPFAHPLFRRTLTGKNLRRGYPSLPVAGEFVLALIISPLLILMPLLFMLILIALLVFNGTIFGLKWALNISKSIAKERQRGTYELFCLSPEGALGVNWAICAGFVHRQNRFEQVHSVMRTVLIVGLGLMLLITLVIVSNSGPGRVSELGAAEAHRALLAFVNSIFLVLAFFLDHVQSITLASLLAILIPTFAQRPLDAQMSTGAVFLLAQTSTYALTGIIGFTILPYLFQNQTEWAALIALPALRVAVFYLIREGLITALWLAIRQRLNVAPVELDVIQNTAGQTG